MVLRVLGAIIATIMVYGSVQALEIGGTEGADSSSGYIGGAGGDYCAKKAGYTNCTDYGNAQAQGYGLTAADAALWETAGLTSDNGSGSTSSDGMSYDNFHQALVDNGSITQSQSGQDATKADFQAGLNCAKVVNTSTGYDTYSGCLTATSTYGYLASLSDGRLYNEATTLDTWDSYCTAGECSTSSKSVFVAAKAEKTAFDTALAKAAGPSDNGTLTLSDITGSGVTLNASTWSSATHKTWLVAYLNASENNQSGNSPLDNATHPTSGSGSWQTKIDALSLSNVAWWYLQNFMSGDITDSSAITAALIDAAGFSSTYSTSAVASSIVSQKSSASASDYSSTSNFETWMSSLINPTWDNPSIGTALAKTTSTATSGSTMVTLTASLPGGETISYSVGGSDNASFSVSSAGVVTAASNLAAGDYNFDLIASYGSSSITKSFTLGVNGAPSFSSVSAQSVSEGASDGDAVATITASDNNSGDTLTYSLSGSSNFTVNSSTGAISVASGASFDYLTTPSYSLTLTATDDGEGTLSDNVTFTVNVTNVEDAPVLASLSAQSLAENASSGSAVTTASATDADGDSITYSISGSGSSNFAINSSSGAITVASSPSFDYETTTSYSITVTATDNTSRTDNETLTVNITNIDEGPSFTGNPASTKTVSQTSTSVFLTVAASDPESDSISFSLSPSACTSKIQINSSNGGIKKKASTTPAGTYNCVVTASANGKSATHNLAVTVPMPGSGCGSNGKWRKFKKVYPQNISGGPSSSSWKVYGPYGNNNRQLNYMNNVCATIGSGWRVPTRAELKSSSQKSHVLACAPSGENELASSTMNGGVTVYQHSGGSVNNKSGSNSSSNKGDILLCYKP